MKTDKQVSKSQDDAADAANSKFSDKKEKKESKNKKEPKIKFENTLTRGEAVIYLQAIIDSLKAGSVSLTQGEQSLELSPCETVEVEVKAGKKGTKEKVSFELKWNTADAKLDISGASDA